MLNAGNNFILYQSICNRFTGKHRLGESGKKINMLILGWFAISSLGKHAYMRPDNYSKGWTSDKLILVISFRTLQLLINKKNFADVCTKKVQELQQFPLNSWAVFKCAVKPLLKVPIISF